MISDVFSIFVFLIALHSSMLNKVGSPASPCCKPVITSNTLDSSCTFFQCYKFRRDTRFISYIVETLSMYVIGLFKIDKKLPDVFLYFYLFLRYLHIFSIYNIKYISRYLYI